MSHNAARCRTAVRGFYMRRMTGQRLRELLAQVAQFSRAEDVHLRHKNRRQSLSICREFICHV